MHMCRHTTSGMGLGPDASDAVRVHMEWGMRRVHRAYITLKAVPQWLDAVVAAH